MLPVADRQHNPAAAAAAAAPKMHFCSILAQILLLSLVRGQPETEFGCGMEFVVDPYLRDELEARLGSEMGW
jgi:hypothetical protein